MSEEEEEVDQLEECAFERPSSGPEFKPESDDDDDEQNGKNSKPTPKNDQPSTSAPPTEPPRRYVDNRWICRNDKGQFMSYQDDVWTPVAESERDLIEQLWFEDEQKEREKAPTTEVNGVKMRWDARAQSWVVAEQDVDDDFIARYQESYGIAYDYESMKKPDDENAARKREASGEANDNADETEAKKKKGPQPPSWVEMDESKTHAVYVSGLPLDITLDEFKEMMQKYGLIQLDPRTNKLKLKLYTDEEGNNKGDGRCVYVKIESVDLALSLLDGLRIRGYEVHAEIAKFELKGEFDPSKKKRRLTAAQKKRFLDGQNRLFEWQPEKSRAYRPHSDCVVIIKHLFALEDIEKDALLLASLKDEVEKSCAKYGTVKKVVIYDNNPDGVVSVSFETTEESDQAVRMLNGRVVRGRRLEVALWDGKTRYKVEESEEARERRMAEWSRYVDGDDEGGEKAGQAVAKEQDEKAGDGSTGTA